MIACCRGLVTVHVVMTVTRKASVVVVQIMIVTKILRVGRPWVFMPTTVMTNMMLSRSRMMISFVLKLNNPLLSRPSCCCRSLDILGLVLLRCWCY